jgi:site-specific DNA-methyltransferase (adenine-specific)
MYTGRGPVVCSMLELNQVYHGDCLEVMDHIDNKSTDMILCDLPYGTTACSWDVIIPFGPLWKQYKRIIKHNGTIVLTATEPFASHLRMSNIKWYKYDWYWKKNQPTGIGTVKYQPMKVIENILVFYKGFGIFNKQNRKSIITDRKLGVGNGKFTVKKSPSMNISSNKIKKISNPANVLLEWVNPVNCLEFKVVSHSKGTLHPTQKPVALFEYLIKTYTNEGDLVLDNCAGSGTTGIAARNLGRNFILIEKEKEYVEVIKKRLDKPYMEYLF